MSDKQDYSFMKSGFNPVQENIETLNNKKNIAALVCCFSKNALKTAAMYVSHSNRNIVVVEDIKRSMMLEVFIFINRPDLPEKLKEAKEMLFSDEDDDDNDDNDDDNDDDSDSIHSFEITDDSSIDSYHSIDDEDAMPVATAAFSSEQLTEGGATASTPMESVAATNNANNDTNNADNIQEMEKDLSKHLFKHTAITDDEPMKYSDSECACVLCKNLNTIKQKSQNWEPENDLQTILKTHINNM